MSEPRTILNVGANYHVRGGSDQYLFSLGRLLETHGHEVIPFAAAHAENQPTEWARFFPPPVDLQRPGLGDAARFIYSPVARRAITRLLAHRRPDIAHLNIYYGQLTSSILAPLKTRNIPIVQTLHEYKIVCPTYSLYAHGHICEACRGRNFWRAAATRCNRDSFARSTLSAVESYVSRWMGAVDRIDHFIAVSDFLRDKVISLGVPAKKITTVHNFIDCGDTVPATQRGSYFLYFGRLERIKGIYTLLDAVEHLPDTPLLVVGHGSERDRVAAEIERRNMGHVKLLGFKTGTELHELIRGSLCTITPSEWFETFGLTLVESFVHGRPVVSSRIGGMTEVVTDGVDGWLVPPGDVGALRDRLAWMKDHPDAAIEMGQQGRRKVERQFSPEKHYQSIMEIYKKVGAG